MPDGGFMSRDTTYLRATEPFGHWIRRNMGKAIGGADRWCATVGSRGTEVEQVAAAWWLSGARSVLIDAPTFHGLATAPMPCGDCIAADDQPERFAMELVFAKDNPQPCGFVDNARGQAPVQSVVVLPHRGWTVVVKAHGYTQLTYGSLFTEDAGEPWRRIVVKAVWAVNMGIGRLVSVQPSGRRARLMRRSFGVRSSVRSQLLMLTPNATATWFDHCGHPGPAPAAPSNQRLSVEHWVRDHTAICWVTAPRVGEFVEDTRRNARGAKLFAVRRPRRGHKRSGLPSMGVEVRLSDA